jgi:PKD repeat protein
MVWAAGEPAVAFPTSALAVNTMPAGASVYVDGQFQGATPVRLEGLAAGDHRVTVVKQGYLENSRVVAVRGGQVQDVTVELTPDIRASMAQVEDEEDWGEEGGGGSSKWLLIGLGAAAVGAGVYLALPKNEPPTVSGVTASPSVGLASVTSVTFTANASDPDGDALTYSWDLGDGTTASGESATHVYDSAGNYNVSVTVTDPDGESATASGSVTIRDLSGTWRGPLQGRTIVFNTVVNMTQSDTSLSGNYRDQYGGGCTVSGSVSAPNNVSFRVNCTGYQPWTFRGTADATFDTLTGEANGSGFTSARWTLSR